MANKEKDNKKYSIDMLWDNISAQYVEEEDSNTDASHRDKLLKLKVIEHLINVVESVAEESEENRKDSIYLKCLKMIHYLAILALWLLIQNLTILGIIKEASGINI